MENLKFDNHILVPFSYYEKLVRCYYGEGANDKSLQLIKEQNIVYEGPTTETNNIQVDSLKNISLETRMPSGFKPGGFAKKKFESVEKDDRND